MSEGDWKKVIHYRRMYRTGGGKRGGNGGSHRHRSGGSHNNGLKQLKRPKGISRKEWRRVITRYIYGNDEMKRPKGMSKKNWRMIVRYRKMYQKQRRGGNNGGGHLTKEIKIHHRHNGKGPAHRGGQNGGHRNGPKNLKRPSGVSRKEWRVIRQYIYGNGHMKRPKGMSKKNWRRIVRYRRMYQKQRHGGNNGGRHLTKEMRIHHRRNGKGLAHRGGQNGGHGNGLKKLKQPSGVSRKEWRVIRQYIYGNGHMKRPKGMSKKNWRRIVRYRRMYQKQRHGGNNGGRHLTKEMRIHHRRNGKGPAHRGGQNGGHGNGLKKLKRPSGVSRKEWQVIRQYIYGNGHMKRPKGMSKKNWRRIVRYRRMYQKQRHGGNNGGRHLTKEMRIHHRRNGKGPAHRGGQNGGHGNGLKKLKRPSGVSRKQWRVIRQYIYGNGHMKRPKGMSKKNWRRIVRYRRMYQKQRHGGNNGGRHLTKEMRIHHRRNGKGPAHRGGQNGGHGNGLKKLKRPSGVSRKEWRVIRQYIYGNGHMKRPKGMSKKNWRRIVRYRRMYQKQRHGGNNGGRHLTKEMRIHHRRNGKGPAHRGGQNGGHGNGLKKLKRPSGVSRKEWRVIRQYIYGNGHMKRPKGISNKIWRRIVRYRRMYQKQRRGGHLKKETRCGLKWNNPRTSRSKTSWKLTQSEPLCEESGCIHTYIL